MDTATAPAHLARPPSLTTTGLRRETMSRLGIDELAGLEVLASTIHELSTRPTNPDAGRAIAARIREDVDRVLVERGLMS